MKTIAILNLKGGVAKTTTAINMAAIMATEHDKRVLLVDADSQGDATKTLLPPGEYNTLADLLLDPMQYVHDLIYRSSVRGLDVLPSDFALAMASCSSLAPSQSKVIPCSSAFAMASYAPSISTSLHGS